MKKLITKLSPFCSPLSSFTHVHAANYCTGLSKTIELQPYKCFKLDSEPSNKATLSKSEAIQYFKQMFQIRRMETACSNLYKEKLVRGFCHLSNGQEAVAVGIKSALSDVDTLITSYRCHGFTYLFGATIHQVIAELMGKKTGISQGKGGSMHMYCPKFYGGNGIVGAQVPLGAGVALAHKHRGDNGVCITLYGDGAANQGQVFEAFNIAKLWNLPCIFVCENNHFSMGTSTHRSAANIEFYTRGDYIPGLWVNGMNLLTVREAIRFARDWCINGHGPILLEIDTYRYFGHSMSDPGISYRTRDEIQEVRKNKDPINSYVEMVIAHGLMDENEHKELEKSIKKEIEDAVKQARQDPTPAVTDVYTHIVYEKNVHDLKFRGCDSMTFISYK